MWIIISDIKTISIQWRLFAFEPYFHLHFVDETTSLPLSCPVHRREIFDNFEICLRNLPLGFQIPRFRLKLEFELWPGTQFFVWQSNLLEVASLVILGIYTTRLPTFDVYDCEIIVNKTTVMQLFKNYQYFYSKGIRNN